MDTATAAAVDSFLVLKERATKAIEEDRGQSFDARKAIGQQLEFAEQPTILFNLRLTSIAVG